MESPGRFDRGSHKFEEGTLENSGGALRQEAPSISLNLRATQQRRGSRRERHERKKQK